jgi:hypothetical protein
VVSGLAAYRYSRNARDGGVVAFQDEVEEQTEKRDHGDYHDRPDNQQNLPERDLLGSKS